MKAEFPLLDFFYSLQRAGLPLGIGDYLTLLRALQGGFGHDLRALKRVCKALWVTSLDEEHLFNYHFAQIEPELLRRQRVRMESQGVERQDLEKSDEVMPAEEMNIPPVEQTEFTPSEPTPPETAELLHFEDEIEAAQMVTAIQVHRQDIEPQTVTKQFVLSGNYFPLTKRQMKQNWRYLRQFVREGICTELDVDATVQEVGRQGFFLKPVLAPRRVNRIDLLLFIDQSGSMAPFHALSERLKETAIRGGKLRHPSVYYFHNCPIAHVYHQPARIEAEELHRVFARLRQTTTRVLIISDAGAARGYFNEQRFEATRDFLNNLRRFAVRVAWLNPLPQFRWLGTTSGAIEQHVPMFEMSRRGLDQAISVLRRRGAQNV